MSWVSISIMFKRAEFLQLKCSLTVGCVDEMEGNERKGSQVFNEIYYNAVYQHTPSNDIAHAFSYELPSEVALQPWSSGL